MGNCIHTMRSKHGNLVRDLSLDDASTKKIKESPQLEVAEQKTGKRRCVKIILTRKQLEQLLLKCPEGVSFKLPETYVMDIQARLMEYKFHFMVATIVSVVLSSLVYAAPIILDILAYFWPLFASTAAFLAIAITFGGFQQLSDEATGEGIMDYVAGRPDDSHKYN
ncbi:hypothetical protein BRARA_A01911 [Brassica rapa]|uniref:Uncharacterized protein n=1 Tax=Brassica campestris TaxID=3711 RepID=A0A398AN58_BRACM|nr:hypothetical protein BRARA_A01911 [Brassica rapa]